MIKDHQKIRIKSQLANRRKTRAFKEPPENRMIEMEYGKAIIKEINKIDKIVKDVLIPELPRLTGEKSERFDVEFDLKSITGMALVAALIARMKGRFYGEVLNPNTEPRQEIFSRSISRTVKPFLDKVKNKTEGTFKKEFESQTGVEPLPQLLNVDEFVEDSLQSNIALIKTIPSQHFSQIETVIKNAVRKGELSATAKAKILEISKASKNRARLIARDQIAKLTGNIEEARQRKNGVTQYLWKTRLDGRVRSFANTNGASDHKRLEGTIQKWSDPPVTVFRGKRAGSRNHPAQDIQCFIKGTMISTENGQKPIEEIKIGDSVHSHWGLQKVVETHKNHYEGDLIGIKLLHKTIWVTPGHKVCLEGGDWKTAEGLKAGDKLVKLEKLFTGNFFHKESARNIEHPHPHLIDKKSMSIGIDCAHGSLNFNDGIKIIKSKVSLIVSPSFAVWFLKNPLRRILNTENIKPRSANNFRFWNNSSSTVSASWLRRSREAVLSSLRIFDPLRHYSFAAVPDFNPKMGENLFNPMAAHARGVGYLPIRPNVGDIFFIEPFIKRLTDFGLCFFDRVKKKTVVCTILRAIFFSFLLGRNALKFFSTCFTDFYHNLPLFIKEILKPQYLHYEVVGLSCQAYNGKIYNFGVNSSMSYFAEGILVENCRCWPQAVYDDITGIDHPDTVRARGKKSA